MIKNGPLIFPNGNYEKKERKISLFSWLVLLKFCAKTAEVKNKLFIFPFYISRKRPSHAQINSFSDSLAYRQSSLTQGEDYTFKEFYHTCFHQFTYLRCNFSIKILENIKVPQ